MDKAEKRYNVTRSLEQSLCIETCTYLEALVLKMGEEGDQEAVTFYLKLSSTTL